MKTEIRDYVRKRAVSEGRSGGKMMSGTDLQKAVPVIERIPDEELARQVRGLLSIVPKYQVLSILSDPAYELMKRFPQHAAELVEAATEVDYKTDTMIPPR